MLEKLKGKNPNYQIWSKVRLEVAGSLVEGQARGKVQVGRRLAKRLTNHSKNYNCDIDSTD